MDEGGGRSQLHVTSDALAGVRLWPGSHGEGFHPPHPPGQAHT